MYDEKIDIAGMLAKIPEIRMKMQDDLSKKLFDIRLKFFYDRCEDDFCDQILDIQDFVWRIPRLKRMADNNPDFQNLIIFGAGKYGKRTYKILKNSEMGGVRFFFVTIIRVF